MKFNITHFDSKSNARSGEMVTDHGTISTPFFMPVGTLGGVKGVHHREIANDIKAEIMLSNTYHLYLRPGLKVLEEIGGLHKFVNWDKPMLTDSGGYQVYSLAERRKITNEGVKFSSHIDGSKHLFTPENVMDIQRSIGADIIMAFDECTPYPCDYEYAKNSMKMTHSWLKRCVNQFNNTENKYGYNQTLFPIVQGSTYEDLRRISAEAIASHDLEGNAIGGLSVGEPAEEMYSMTDIVCNILPKDKPRYLMGVGTPINLLENIALGIDMFDCVMPTRNGRNGMIFTYEGMINIKNRKWKHDYSPLDPNNITYVDSQYSRAYLYHLFNAKEMLGSQIASIHNLGFYIDLLKKAKEQIENDTFASWKDKMVKSLATRL